MPSFPLQALTHHCHLAGSAGMTQESPEAAKIRQLLGRMQLNRSASIASRDDDDLLSSVIVRCHCLCFIVTNQSSAFQILGRRPTVKYNGALPDSMVLPTLVPAAALMRLIR